VAAQWDCGRIGCGSSHDLRPVSAAFFTASLIHLPLGPGNVHLILSGLMAAVLGWAAAPSILTALFLQALFFQFGGFTVLGVNTVIMAAPALLLAALLRPSLVRPGRRVWPLSHGCRFSPGFVPVLSLGTGGNWTKIFFPQQW